MEKKLKITICHPTGNRNVRAVAEGLYKAEMLHEFYTCVALFQNSHLYSLAGLAPFREFRKRVFSEALKPHIRSHPFKELIRLSAQKFGLKKWILHEKGIFCVDMIYQDLDTYVSKNLDGVKAVYAYEDGALECFKKAKQQGAKCVYDLPIAYWETSRRLLREEAERLPAWAKTIGGLEDSEAKLERKSMELDLADVVVGPGSFVMDSLPHWANKKKQIISPFGSPTIGNNLNVSLKKKHGYGRSLKVLFAGSMSQRKGLGDLFAAMKMLNKNDVELVVLGSLQAPLSFYRSQLTNFTYEPCREHSEVLALMRSCDIFCLPSIVEGRALVMQEAMSQGLPLIITPNTGGKDLIEEGKTGFLVPIRSPEAIAEKIQWFIDNKPSIIPMGESAHKLAGKYTWENYSDNIIHELKHFFNTEYQEINQKVVY